MSIRFARKFTGLCMAGVVALASGCWSDGTSSFAPGDEGEGPDALAPPGEGAAGGQAMEPAVPVETEDVTALGLVYGTETVTAANTGFAQLALSGGDEDMFSRLRSRATLLADARVDANLEAVLNMIENGVSCPVYEYEVVLIDGGGSTRIEGGETSEPSSEADQYSTTNTQVQGVDEADFVKNDGSYIYVVSGTTFQIIDAWPPADSREISAVEIEGTAKKLYVEGDIALIYSSLGPIGTEVDPYDLLRNFAGGSNLEEKECTYGYNCEFTGDGHALKITLFDISDRFAPVLMREIRFNGSYLNSRRIDNAVHTALVFPDRTLAGVTDLPQVLQDQFETCSWEYQDPPFTEAEVSAMFEELREENRRLIEAASLTELADLFPAIEDTRYENGNPVSAVSLLTDWEKVYFSEIGDGSGFLSVVSLAMDGLEEPSAATIVGKPGAVYASPDALYVAVRHHAYGTGEWYFEPESEITDATSVHKFALFSHPPSAAYVGSGVTKGRILNQFSMDEYEGFLRMATTSGRLPGSDVHSTLSVFAERELASGETVLEVRGLIDNIAPSEDIRSVRFSGDTGFIVTFKKTDPLFVLDLSRPEDPVVTGALKIPGFSTYIHLMDENHLLTMGYDADDQGSFAWFQGVRLQVIDVSDMQNPMLTHKEVIGTRGSTSEAAVNHLAFNYFPARDLLAVPMTICESSGLSDGYGGSFGDLMTFSGLLVYRVTAAEGFTALGGVPHREPETEDSYHGWCNTWWTDADSVVKRSIFMSDAEDDFVFSVALDLINVSNLDDLEAPLASVQLGP